MRTVVFALPSGGEGGEIVGAQQLLGRLVHQPVVQGHGNMGGEIAIQRAGMGRIVDAIGVQLAVRLKAGVKIRRHGQPRRHPDIRGQIAVEHKGEFFGRDGGTGVKMRPLAQGVHPRVRAGRAPVTRVKTPRALCSAFSNSC